MLGVDRPGGRVGGGGYGGKVESGILRVDEPQIGWGGS